MGEINGQNLRCKTGSKLIKNLELGLFAGNLFQDNDETKQKAVWSKSITVFRNYLPFFASLAIGFIAIIMMQNPVYSCAFADQATVEEQNFENQYPPLKSHEIPCDHLNSTNEKVSHRQTTIPLTRAQKMQRFYEEGVRLFAHQYLQNSEIPDDNVDIIVDGSVIPDHKKSTRVFVVFFKNLTPKCQTNLPSQLNSVSSTHSLDNENQQQIATVPSLFLKVIGEFEKESHQRLKDFLLYYDLFEQAQELLLFPINLVQIKKPQWLDAETYNSFWTFLHVFPYYQNGDIGSFIEKHIKTTMSKPLHDPLKKVFYGWGLILAKLHNFGMPRLCNGVIQTLLIHGDLHENNILWDEENLRIIDFETLGLCDVVKEFAKMHPLSCLSCKNSITDCFTSATCVKTAMEDLDASYYDCYLDIKDVFRAMCLQSVFSRDPIMEGGDYLSKFVKGYCYATILESCGSSTESPMETVFKQYAHSYLLMVDKEMQQPEYFSARKKKSDDFLTNSERASILACFADEDANLSRVYQNVLKEHELFQK